MKIDFRSLDKYTYENLKELCVHYTGHKLIRLTRKGNLVLRKNKGLFSISRIRDLSLDEFLDKKIPEQISIKNRGSKDFSLYYANEAQQHINQSGLSAVRELINYHYNLVFGKKIISNSENLESKENKEDFSKKTKFGFSVDNIIGFFSAKKSITLRKAQVKMAALTISGLLLLNNAKFNKVIMKAKVLEVRPDYLGNTLRGIYNEDYYNTS